MQQALASASLRELETQWRIIDDALKPGPWFPGEKYSLCDMLVLMQATWVENQPAELAQFPHAVNMIRGAFKRPAVERIIAEHGIEALSNI